VMALARPRPAHGFSGQLFGREAVLAAGGGEDQDRLAHRAAGDLLPRASGEADLPPVGGRAGGDLGRVVLGGPIDGPWPADSRLQNEDLAPVLGEDRDAEVRETLRARVRAVPDHAAGVIWLPVRQH
jgi:hypothetical protein